MPVKKTDKIWMNGSLVNWDDAKIHVLSHVVHYGSSWFEGVRCYKTAKGSGIFRLDSHLRRLADSAKIYRTRIPYSTQQLEDAVIATVRANNLSACYIRPVVYRGYGDVGLNPLTCPVDVAIAVWEWGTYLGQAALTDGIDVCVSAWNRPAPNTLPMMSKAGGNYVLSALMKIEALEGGFGEAVALDVNGFVSEGSGENVFIVRDGVIHTPSISSSLLPGITRQSVIQLAREAGYQVVEMNVPREMLYIADEVFFTGTAVEITPVKSVDRVQIGSGVPGPITRALQKAFFDIVKEGIDTRGWLRWL
jgi:branched-chain amino acid aminotransferase